jgi:hypothetical protein
MSAVRVLALRKKNAPGFGYPVPGTWYPVP